MTPPALVGSCGFHRVLDAGGPLEGFPATIAMLVKCHLTPIPATIPIPSVPSTLACSALDPLKPKAWGSPGGGRLEYLGEALEVSRWDMNTPA